MTSKERILANIKNNNKVNSVNLPSYENFGIKFDNKFETFSTMLESVGGKALLIEKLSERGTPLDLLSVRWIQQMSKSV